MVDFGKFVKKSDHDEDSSTQNLSGQLTDYEDLKPIDVAKAFPSKKEITDACDYFNDDEEKLIDKLADSIMSEYDWGSLGKDMSRAQVKRIIRDAIADFTRNNPVSINMNQLKSISQLKTILSDKLSECRRCNLMDEYNISVYPGMGNNSAVTFVDISYKEPASLNIIKMNITLS